MSTRSQMRWIDCDEVVATIYRHSDGYPDGENGVIADLKKFIKWLTGGDQPRPIGDIEYASANWIYWNKKNTIEHLSGDCESDEEKKEIAERWEKIGFGICPNTDEHIHGDTEYLYEFDGHNIKVSEHLRWNPDEDDPKWSTTVWEFSGTFNDAVAKYVGDGK